MRKIISVLTLSLVMTLLISCDALTGVEVARLAVNEVTVDNTNLIIKETSLDLKKGDEISIWSEMDFEYEGDVELRFKIEILKDGEQLGRLEINPTEYNMSLGEVKTTWNGKTDWSFTGKNSEIKIEDDGNYTFKALLIASENPSLKVAKAEVLLKK